MYSDLLVPGGLVNDGAWQDHARSCKIMVVHHERIRCKQEVRVSMLQSIRTNPIVILINPGVSTRLILGSLLVGVCGGMLAMRLAAIPVWGVVLAVLVLLMVAAIPKWQADQRHYGTPVMVLSILVAAQGFHTVEHIAQIIQYHVLGWSARAAVGLISPANAEWVHFTWNWLVLVVVIYLFRAGMRGWSGWALLIWSGAHTFEHSYLMLRYMQMLAELRELGITNLSAQGLPGIVGRDGWLARSDLTRGTFLCTLPGLATAPRLDVHFWWNAGEMLLALFAAGPFLKHKGVGRG